jgi:hypothetical protein
VAEAVVALITVEPVGPEVLVVVVMVQAIAPAQILLQRQVLQILVEVAEVVEQHQMELAARAVPAS